MWALEFKNSLHTCYNDQGTVDIVKMLRLIDKEYADTIVEVTTRCELALQNMFKDTYKFYAGMSDKMEYPIKERIHITFEDYFHVIEESLRKQKLPTIGVLITINAVHKVTTTFNLSVIHSNEYEDILKEHIFDVLSDVYTWNLHSVTYKQRSV